jgi:hypothetical protein
VPTTVEDWDIPDPAGRPTEEVRTIRDAIAARVSDLIETKLDAVRADRTAHQVHLAQLPPDLAREFDGLRSAGEIRACADAILTRYDNVPVRSYVLTLADRQTRDCPAADTCDALAVAPN